MPRNTPKLITVEEAARRLSLHQRTIRRYVSQGKLPGHRVGGWALRLDQADVDALVRPVTSAARQ